MKRLFALLVASLFAFPAFALGFGNDNQGGTGIATATQGQNQGQNQGQLQGQGQAQFTNVDVSNRISNDVRSNAAAFAGGGSASSGGNSLTVNAAPIPTQTTTRIEQSDYTVKNVPAVFSGNVYPTAPCMGSSTVGGAGVGFGFSVGTSWKDDECGIRETSRSFSGLGLKDDAIKILCTSQYAAAAPSCAKPE